jgi:vitamin B12/bleomycin/antimicrobial peptide transport system ATP-binding/permease protein
LLIVVVNLVASYSMNVWSRVIFDALEKRDSATVLELSILYLPLLAGSVSLTILQLWARMTMQRRWREWLNKLLLDRWLKNGRYYQLSLVGSIHKNPECRIADDVRIATEAPVEFAAGATSAVLSAAMFIAVLWTVGGAFTVHIGGTALTIPGFLVVAAAVYAVVASGTMLAAGRRLVAVSETKDQAEAEYRYLLTRVRENGEGIALLHGDDEEHCGADKSFKTVFLAWRDVCIQTIASLAGAIDAGEIAPEGPP